VRSAPIDLRRAGTGCLADEPGRFNAESCPSGFGVPPGPEDAGGRKNVRAIDRIA
jgi:hypothetical protein